MNPLSSFRALAIAVLVHVAGPVTAAPIVYTVSGFGSGHIGSDEFVNSAFVLTGTADTDSVVSIDVGVVVNPLMSMGVDVAGHGSALAVNAFDFFANNSLSEVGFLDELVGDVMDVSGSGLLAFDGASALSTVAVNPDFLAAFSTTSGDFQLDDAHVLSFTSRLDRNIVPAPPTLLLVLTALVVSRLVRSRAK